MTPNYYDILGLTRDASYEDVKRAWRHKANQWHPDKFLSAEEKLVAHERFVAIMEAYMVLIDPASRARYDSRLANAQSYHVYTGYENASPAADQREASDMYQAMLRETPLEFTGTTLFLSLMVLVFPFTLLGVIVMFAMLFGIMKEEPRLTFVGQTLLLFTFLVNLFLLMAEVAMLINLYHRIRRILKLATLMVRGRRIFSRALTTHRASA